MENGKGEMIEQGGKRCKVLEKSKPRLAECFLF